MRTLLKIIAGLLLIGFVLVILNWKTISRLQKVNTMFEEDNIVQNFSNMNKLLFTRQLETNSRPYIWQENLQPLPEFVQVDGEERALGKNLELTKATALLVIKDGQIVSEEYFLGTGQDDKRISWSVAKSFLSAMFGIAVENGDIKSLDEQVIEYVPELKGSAYDGATIRNVLNMSSGVKFNEDYLDRGSDINRMGRVLALGQSMDAFAVSLTERAREPGSGRQYVSIDTHVIGMVLRAATGQNVSDYFVENVWSKLGPGEGTYYLTDKNGIAFVLGGLNMRTRDYALFGQMMMQGGQWQGEQIIPANWVASSTAGSAPADVENMPLDYGYQWWVPQDSHGDYFAIGIYGQYIYIDPSAKMVIVKNSAHRDFMGAAPSGKGFILENIDVFRSIVDHYDQDG